MSTISTNPGIVLPLGFWVTGDGNFPIVFGIWSGFLLLELKALDRAANILLHFNQLKLRYLQIDHPPIVARPLPSLSNFRHTLDSSHPVFVGKELKAYLSTTFPSAILLSLM